MNIDALLSPQFLRPELLWVLVGLLPLTLLIYLVSARARHGARANYGDADLVDRYTRSTPWWHYLFGGSIWLAVVTLLVVAAAGPFQAETPDKVKAGTLQVVVVTDVSRSMAAEDYRDLIPKDELTGAMPIGQYGNRLDVVKLMMGRIMKSIQGNELGVVTYCGEGFPQVDLTTDFTAVRFVLSRWIKIGSAPGGGSDYARGLKVALETFKREDDEARQKDPTYTNTKQRVIVLFSDGGFTGEQPELNQVVADIRAAGVRVVVMGVGSRQPVPIPVYEKDVPKGFVSKNGQIVLTAIDEAPLHQLAAATGGEYIYIDAGSPLPTIDWSNTLGGTREEPQTVHLYHYPAAAALAALAILALMGAARSKRDVR